ncbi:MAG: NAD(P)/FAD-dependent oxidoreductase [Promethearchaeota archaeon]
MPKTNQNYYSVIIVGCGPAGIACAIQLKRSNIDFKIICKNFGGIANNANKIENLLGFPNGISGKSFVSLLKQHFDTLSIHFTKDIVQNVSKEEKKDHLLFRVKCANGEYFSKFLVIASGTSPKKLNLSGESELWDHKLLYYEMANFGFEKNIKKIAIVGSGDAAYDYALNLVRFPVKVEILQRSEKAKSLLLLQKRAQDNSNIKIISNIELRSLEEENNKIRIIAIRGSKEEIRNYDFIFVAIGRSPNINFLSADLSDVYRSSKRFHGLYFIGDVKNKNNRQISIALGDGVKSAMEITRDLFVRKFLK